MSITLGDLVFWIRGDKSKMKGDLADAGAEAKVWGAAISASLKKQLEYAGGELMATGLRDLSNGIQRMTKDALESTQRYTEQIADLSRQTGATLEESSRLYNVADDLRVEYGDLSTALKLYGKTLKDSGSQEQLSVKTLARLSDEYLKLAPGVERNNYLLANFGRGGMAMGRILEKGSAELLKMNDAVEASLIINEEAIKKAEEYRLALDDWDDAMLGVKIQLMQTLFPYLKQFTDFLTSTAIPVLSGLVKAFTALPAPLQWVIIGFAGLLILSLKIGPTLLGIVGILSMFGEGGALAGVGAFITGSLIPAFGTMAAAVVTFLGTITAPVWGLIAAIGLLIVALVTLGPKALATSRMLWTIFGAVVKRLAADLRVWFSTVGASIVAGIGDGIMKGWGWLVTTVQNLAKSMLAAAKAALIISSPSKAFRDQVGLNAALGMEEGFTSYMPKMAANMRGSLTGLAPATVGAGNISVGHVEFHGALSEAEQDRLDKRSLQMSRRTILEALS
jgi:hypothetical protein